MASLGKGLMKLLTGGGGSSSKHHHKDTSTTGPTTTATTGRPGPAGGYDTHDAPKTADQERAEYLASLEQRGGGDHTRMAAGYGGYAGGGGGRRREDLEGEEVPTAPALVSLLAAGVATEALWSPTCTGCSLHHCVVCWGQAACHSGVACAGANK